MPKYVYGVGLDAINREMRRIEELIADAVREKKLHEIQIADQDRAIEVFTKQYNELKAAAGVLQKETV